MLKFGLIVPTLNAGSKWLDWLGAFNVQMCKPDKLIVIDSSSTDKTINLAKEHGFTVEVIGREEFNHGGTRQYGLSFLGSVDVVVFLTQDAIFSGVDSLFNILKPFQNSSVAAVCGRQLPRKEATAIEAHARLYNYFSEAFIRSIKDVNKFGLKTAFISNSFAAYRISALNEVGGFPGNVIFGEDMYVAAKLLKAGYKIAYAADACVYHSHDYSFWQEFKRYFDMGVFHSHEPWIRQDFGGAEGEGVKFVVSEVQYLLKNAIWRIPEAFFRTLLRYTGFRLGLLEKWIPLRFKNMLAMNKSFFKE